MAGEMTQLAKTRIGQAIRDNNFLELKWLIENGEDIFYKDRKGNTYFHYICSMYRPDCFHILSATKLNINAQNKFGYTPLHVTTFKKNCLHVYDVMACGADFYIKDQWGKTAYDMAVENTYWRQAFKKYQPGMFTAVENHEVERVRYLLKCWFKVECFKNGQTLRQFAAAHKFHDIVLILDQHKATMDVIYGVKERNYEKVRNALKKSWCKVNFLNKSINKPHILQHAIKMKDAELVKMLCDAGANINERVLINEYFWGPLYFEAINNSVPEGIMMTVLKAGANFRLKDERGRTGIMYALDKTNGKLPINIFNFLLKSGSYLADRDQTGVTVRDIALFARRSDVRDLIDKFYVNIIRNSEIQNLEQLACDGYDIMLNEFNMSKGDFTYWRCIKRTKGTNCPATVSQKGNVFKRNPKQHKHQADKGALKRVLVHKEYRDAYIYAAGNETEDAGKFVEWLPKFLSLVEKLQGGIEDETCGYIQRLFDECDKPILLANCRDRGMRTPLMLATMYAREDIVRFLLLTEYCELDLQDCNGRTALHYSYLLDIDGKNIRKYLINAGADSNIEDNKNKSASDFDEMDVNDKDKWIEKERMAKYGMLKEVMCIKKYEELRKIIKAKRKGLEEFSQALKFCKYPVGEFPSILSPLVEDYRDLIFLAVDYGKADIVGRLADLNADLRRKEMYKYRIQEYENDLQNILEEKENECRIKDQENEDENESKEKKNYKEVYMNVIERATSLGYGDLAGFLQSARERQKAKARKNRTKIQEIPVRPKTDPCLRTLQVFS